MSLLSPLLYRLELRKPVGPRLGTLGVVVKLHFLNWFPSEDRPKRSGTGRRGVFEAAERLAMWRPCSFLEQRKRGKSPCVDEECPSSRRSVGEGDEAP